MFPALRRVLLEAQVESQTRRHFLKSCQLGLGAIALEQLQGLDSSAATERLARDDDPENPLAVKQPMHKPLAKNVIYLHMEGSPPQHELFDYKPALEKFDRKECPAELLEGKTFAFIKGTPFLLGPQAKFSQQGKNGIWISDKLPQLSRHVDDLCLVKSMFTDQFNHAPAQLLLHTGSPQFGSASFGSWVMYGLGTENENLPGYMVLVSGGNLPSGGKSLWSSGFLPSVFQGVQCRNEGDPILFVSNPPGMSRNVRRASLDALNELNQREADQFHDPETLTRIKNYELAFRMQVAVPEVMDLSRESAETLAAYGARPGEASFANNCLLARRLVEQGVRFVQLFDWGWDIHGTGPHDDLQTQFPLKCKQTDQPIAALLDDLKQRGMLDDTLVIWGGEFGRTPMNEARNGSDYLGRDHHPDCFTIWMAGGKTKPGFSFGETDELGYKVTENGVSIRDLQATLMHILGLNPHQLQFAFQGLNQRWIGPDNAPKIRHELLR
jgi:hypothetical protein